MAILPDTYQWVEYIESSGTQWIDTGFTPSVNTEINTSLSWGGTQIAWAVFFGVTSNDSSTDGILGRLYYDANNTGSVQTFNAWFCNSTYGECQTSTSLDTFHKVKLKANYCTLDGTSLTLTTSGTPYQGNIYLFCGNNGGSAWRYGNCKIKNFKIYESGTLVRDFVPCYRKADGVIGLYDVVNNQFYTNSGTGTFIKGPDKILKVSRVYVGTEQVRPKKASWVLYKETDFKNSSYGGFRTAGWYNAGSPSYTGFNTTDGYIYSTSSHARCKICPDTSDLALFQSAKAIKIVTDGFMVGNNTNRYNSWVGLGGWWQEFGKKSTGMNYPTLLSGTALTYGVWYKSETILTNEDSLITTLDNGSSYGITYSSGLWNQLVSTSANSYFYPSASDSLMCMAEVALDNGTTSYLKDVHVYLLLDQ